MEPRVEERTRVMPDIVGQPAYRAAAMLAARGILVRCWCHCACTSDPTPFPVGRHPDALVICTRPRAGDPIGAGEPLVGVEVTVNS